MNNRFSEDTCEIVMISEIFNPSCEDYFNSKSKKLHNFINHYKYFEFNFISIISEFSTAKSLIESKNVQKPDIHFILKTLSELSSAFIETLKLLTILLTLPVTTATNEHFFFFKTC